jgi:Transposase IS66 family
MKDQFDRQAEGDAVRLAELRLTESVVVLAELKAWLWEQASLTSISIGKAAAYTLANWERLTRFVEDARIPLDNNATERAIRGPVVGRKNHYGSKSRRGTRGRCHALHRARDAEAPRQGSGGVSAHGDLGGGPRKRAAALAIQRCLLSGK